VFFWDSWSIILYLHFLLYDLFIYFFIYPEIKPHEWLLTRKVCSKILKFNFRLYLVTIYFALKDQSSSTTQLNIEKKNT